MELSIVLEPLDGGDRLSGALADRSAARPRSAAVDHHRAGAATSLATAILAARQVEFIPQDPEQVAVRLGRDLMLNTVDQDRKDLSHRQALDLENVNAATSVIRVEPNGVNDDNLNSDGVMPF
jgi:hypothetical protein